MMCMHDFFVLSQMSSKVLEITSVGDYEIFKNNHRRGVIFYGAKWCHACNDIEPLYRRIANRYHKRIAMAHADIDECKLDFDRIPVFVAFYNGKELTNMEGADFDGLKQFIREVIEYKEIEPAPKKRQSSDSSDERVKKVKKHHSSDSSEERPKKVKKRQSSDSSDERVKKVKKRQSSDSSDERVKKVKKRNSSEERPKKVKKHHSSDSSEERRNKKERVKKRRAPANTKKAHRRKSHHAIEEVGLRKRRDKKHR